jgi:hypothetical protein
MSATDFEGLRLLLRDRALTLDGFDPPEPAMSVGGPRT